MKEIKAYVRTTRLPFVLMALEKLDGFPGVSVCEVRGFGGGRPRKSNQRLVEFLMEPNQHVKLEIICKASAMEGIISVIREQALTKEGNDGKIFVSPIEETHTIGIGNAGP